MKKINPERNWRSVTSGFSGVWERNPWIASQRAGVQFEKLNASSQAQWIEREKPKDAALSELEREDGRPAITSSAQNVCR
jgi:hypothetical protein